MINLFSCVDYQVFLSPGDQGALGTNNKYEATEQNGQIGPENSFVK